MYSAYSITSSAPAANMYILIGLICRTIKLVNSILTEKKKNVYFSYCYLIAEFSRDLSIRTFFSLAVSFGAQIMNLKGDQETFDTVAEGKLL